MDIRVTPASAMPANSREAILDLLERAYGEDLRPLYATLVDPVHVVGMLGGAPVSHALWVTRWLSVDDGPPLRTAYVESVATDPLHRRRGHASRIMRALVKEIGDYPLAALCASDEGEPLYAAVGWERWRGPLFIRADPKPIATPHEVVMIHRTAHTPPIDLAGRLSAEWRPGELW